MKIIKQKLKESFPDWYIEITIGEYESFDENLAFQIVELLSFIINKAPSVEKKKLNVAINRYATYFNKIANMIGKIKITVSSDIKVEIFTREEKVQVDYLLYVSRCFDMIEQDNTIAEISFGGITYLIPKLVINKKAQGYKIELDDFAFWPNANWENSIDEVQFQSILSNLVQLKDILACQNNNLLSLKIDCKMIKSDVLSISFETKLTNVFMNFKAEFEKADITDLVLFLSKQKDILFRKDNYISLIDLNVSYLHTTLKILIQNNARLKEFTPLLENFMQAAFDYYSQLCKYLSERIDDPLDKILGRKLPELPNLFHQIPVDNNSLEIVEKRLEQLQSFAINLARKRKFVKPFKELLKELQC